MDDIKAYSIPGFREPFSCLTHLIAVPVFAVLGYFLVRRGHGPIIRTASLAIMALSTVFLLSMSGVYHLLGQGAGRQVMRQLDVAGVFALMAGTITPVHAILFRGFSRWGPLVLIWSAAITGITLRSIFPYGLLDRVGTGLFLLMGWSGLVSCIILWRRYSFGFVSPLLWGGVGYTLGAFVLGLQWPTVVPSVVGPHELWHVAVILGLGLHWKFVFQFADGASEPDARRQKTEAIPAAAVRATSRFTPRRVSRSPWRSRQQP